jgi:hypothetical protein
MPVGIGNLNQPMLQVGAPPVAQPATPTPYGLSAAESGLISGQNSAASTLRGAISNIGRGEREALGVLDTARSGIGGIYNRANADLSGFDPYTQSGAANVGLQDALTGALGADAQAQAIANYQESPYVDAVRSNAERAIMRNAAARGGIGSGNTLDQLYQNAAGLFMNDYNNRIGQLNAGANRGLTAQGQKAGIGANLAQGEAAAMGNLYSQSAGIPLQASGMQANAAGQIANTFANTGYNLGQLRYGAGQDIANAVGSTVSALANLTADQGAGLADLTGASTTSVTNLINAAAEGDAGAKEMLAQLTSQLAAAGAGVNPAQVVQTNRLGQVGQLAGGIGGLMSAFPRSNNRNIDIGPQAQGLGSPADLSSAFSPLGG